MNTATSTPRASVAPREFFGRKERKGRKGVSLRLCVAAFCVLAVPTASFAAVTPVIDGSTYTFTVESGTETYTTAISGDAPVVDLDPATYGGWVCTKSGNSLRFGFPQPFVMTIR